MGDEAYETNIDEPHDLPDAKSLAVTIAHAAESLIASQMESQQAKLAVFRAFCTAFDQMAAQFTSGHARNPATALATGTARSMACPRALIRT